MLFTEVLRAMSNRFKDYSLLKEQWLDVMMVGRGFILALKDQCRWEKFGAGGHGHGACASVCVPALARVSCCTGVKCGRAGSNSIVSFGGNVREYSKRLTSAARSGETMPFASRHPRVPIIPII